MFLRKYRNKYLDNRLELDIIQNANNLQKQNVCIFYVNNEIGKVKIEMLHKRQHNWIAQFTFSYLHMQDSSHLSNYLYKFVILIYLFSLFCVPAQEYNVHLRNFQKILIQVFNHIFFKETLVFLVFALSPFFPSVCMNFTIKKNYSLGER